MDSTSSWGARETMRLVRRLTRQPASWAWASGRPAIQRAAEGVTAGFKLPRAVAWRLFGLQLFRPQTAVLHKAQELGTLPGTQRRPDAQVVAEVAAAFQEAVVDVIAVKAIRAVERHVARGLVLGGGVSATPR